MKTTATKFWPRVFLFLLIGLGLGLPSANAQPVGRVSSINKYAWSEASGWQNFKPAFGGVTIHSDHLTGYAWAANIGWIKLGSDSGGPYANTTASNWGVNRDQATGALSGYAWSEAAGWITFSQVTIDPATGDFTGSAWNTAIGYIHFQNEDPAYKVRAIMATPFITEGDSVSITMSEDSSPTPFDLTLHATFAGEAPLSWSVMPTGASHGTANASGTGNTMTVDYTPMAYFHGTDSFTVMVDDGYGDGLMDSITVNVTVENETINQLQQQVAGKDAVIAALTKTNTTLTEQFDTCELTQSYLSYGDFDEDGDVDALDLDWFSQAFGATEINVDNDGDGYSEIQGDCDDVNTEVRPGVVEVCGDGIDNTCDGKIDEDCVQ